MAAIMDLPKLLDVARNAARDAVAVHRRHLGRVPAEAWSEKGSADFVSFVDHEAEAVIVERIRSAFPAHHILAEEAATAKDAPAAGSIGDQEWTWIIDPLDGTTNFLHRYPMYAASVAVAHCGQLVAGAVMSGASGEEWYAVRGGGAFQDGRRIYVSGLSTMAQALIGTGFPFKTLDQLPDYLLQFQRLMRGSAGIRRAGAAAVDLCHVAAGYFDGFWELWLAPWDIAAGALMVREAGGRVTRPDGTEDVLGDGAIVAGNPAIHQRLLEILEDTRDPADETSKA